MGSPAVRVRDAAGAGHNPPLLSPGIGCTTVLIGNSPAWRATQDRHLCMMPLAPPPAAPTPHGPETCYLGSLSVLISNQMAVRQGDVLIGIGPPNRIARGQNNVLIGTTAFGLADPASMSEFCKDFCRMMLVWPHLNEEEKEAVMSQVINKQLGKADVPWTEVKFARFSSRTKNGELNFPEWRIDISETKFLTDNLTKAQKGKLASTLYHEARHAEQWSKMARSQAAGGRSASQISRDMGIRPTQMAADAVKKPLPLNGSPQAVFGQAMHESVYGSRGDYREKILNSGTHEQYKSLPEEEDAWAVGDGTGGCGGCEGCG